MVSRIISWLVGAIVDGTELFLKMPLNPLGENRSVTAAGTGAFIFVPTGGGDASTKERTDLVRTLRGKPVGPTTR